ncbi:hypothetical protein [Salmonella sp. s51944]|uniref:hypothetical protein n=1 Tax=Salmonella sp. s51944 TaxID=3159655 RepID=UPI00398089AA
MGVLTAINKQIKSMKQPTGNSKENAVRSCRNLFLDHPDYESGTYWIDPNLGCTDDAIQVFCDKITKETCIRSESNIVTNATWYSGTPKRIYYSSMRGGERFVYAEKSQLIFMRLLSIRARQTVTFYCRNVVADLELLSSTDEVIRNLESEVNGCQFTSDTWGKTVLTYSTDTTENLPFKDFSVGDIGADNQEFGLEMGPVCFA